MNRHFWSADAHVRSPLTRTWASGLLSLGGSWSQCAGFGPWKLPMNLVGPTCWSAAVYPSQPRPRSRAALPGSGAEIAAIGGPLVLSPLVPRGTREKMEAVSRCSLFLVIQFLIRILFQGPFGGNRPLSGQLPESSQQVVSWPVHSTMRPAFQLGDFRMARSGPNGESLS